MPKLSVRPSILRRPNDFQSRGQVTLYNGCCSCCCCCCLHWLGAAAGGFVGLAMGSGPPPPGVVMHRKARRNTVRGAVFVILLLAATAVLFLLSLSPGYLQWLGPYQGRVKHVTEYVAISIAFVPCAILLLMLLGMLAGAWLTSGRTAARRGADGYGCLKCGYDLRGSLQQGRCPECGQAFDAAGLPARVESRYRLAWRSGGLGFLLSLGGTIIGYLIMLLMWGLGQSGRP